MPAKGSKLLYGNRDHIISVSLYKRFIAETNVAVDYKTFVKVIKKSNTAIVDTVCQEQTGFKLPENLGYLVVTRYKGKKAPTDFNSTKKYNTKVIHNNLHSNGDMFSLRWFNNRITKGLYSRIYKYKGARTFTRKVAKSIKNETQFLSWKNTDFFNYNQLSNFYKPKEHVTH